MRATGNSDVDVCISNLLHTFQDEVPYAREKGISIDIIDKPLAEAVEQFENEATEIVEEYENRAELEQIDKSFIVSELGHIRMDVSAAAVYEEDEE